MLMLKPSMESKVKTENRGVPIKITKLLAR